MEEEIEREKRRVREIKKKRERGNCGFKSRILVARKHYCKLSFSHRSVATIKLPHRIDDLPR